MLSSWLITLPLVVLGLLFVFAALFIATVRNVIMAYGSPELKVECLDPDRYDELAPVVSEIELWAQRHNFEWLGAWQIVPPGMPPTTVFIWKRLRDGLTLEGHIAQGRAIASFCTTYSQGQSLDTCSHAIALNLPCASGNFAQAFPDVDLSELLRRHDEGDRFLRTNHRLRAIDDQRPVEQLIAEEIRKRHDQVLSYTLWPLRILWWTGTARFRAGIPIDRQRTAEPGFPFA